MPHIIFISWMNQTDLIITKFSILFTADFIIPGPLTNLFSRSQSHSVAFSHIQSQKNYKYININKVIP